MSVDLTTGLAVAQTVAGFGAIIAAILLPIWQVRRTRIAERQRMVDFIGATVALIAEMDEAQQTWVEAQGSTEHGASMNGSARWAWITRWAETRDALTTLRNRAPPDAGIVMALTRCVRTMDRGANSDMFTDPASLGLRIADVTSNLNKARGELEPLAAALRRGIT